MVKALAVKTEAPTPWRPFMDLDRWEGDTERMVDQFFGRTMKPWWPEGWFRSEPMAVNAPSVDVYVDKNDVVISAELPGMNKDDIEVNLSDHMITLKGVKKRKEKVKEENYYYAERTYGSSSRTVELPWDVQGEKVKASFTDGVLVIRLPMAETAKAKSVKVKVEDDPTATTGQD